MGKIVDFEKYRQRYFDKNVEVVFGDNLLALSYEDEQSIKADGIILEQDSLGIMTPEENSYILKEDIFDDEDFEDFAGDVFSVRAYELGDAYIEGRRGDRDTPPTIFDPLKVRIVVFDMINEPEGNFYSYRKLVSAYMKAFSIMKKNDVKKIRLRLLGAFYNFIPIEDSLRAVLRALDNFVFEKVYIILRNREEVKLVWSYLLPFIERKELEKKRKSKKKDGN